jgi:hypothetical protein
VAEIAAIADMVKLFFHVNHSLNVLIVLSTSSRAVRIAIGYGLDDRGVGVRVLVVSRIFISPVRPDRLWGPPNLLSSGYRGSFLGGKAAGA